MTPVFPPGGARVRPWSNVAAEHAIVELSGEPYRLRSSSGPAHAFNPVQCDHFKFVWDRRKFTVVYSFCDDKEVKPDQLREKEQLLAA
tara:strand:+ start:390 stop:653 length:264 start_codon:yes stop_codon:yes gene_type:complete